MFSQVKLKVHAVSLLPSVIGFIWGLCAKVLCRFLEAANQSGDPVSAGVFRSEIEVFRYVDAQKEIFLANSS